MEDKVKDGVRLALEMMIWTGDMDARDEIFQHALKGRSSLETFTLSRAALIYTLNALDAVLQDHPERHVFVEQFLTRAEDLDG